LASTPGIFAYVDDEVKRVLEPVVKEDIIVKDPIQ
jgi:hypothetical protein